LREERLRDLLEQVASRKLRPEKAFSLLKNLPYEDIGFARIDHHRTLRKGFPEVIFSPGKTQKQVLEIAKRLYKQNGSVLVTRAELSLWRYLQKRFRKIGVYDEMGRVIILQNGEAKKAVGNILVITAGTGDIPVAAEAVATARALGNRVDTLYDVGVAGIHRLLSEKSRMNKARVMVVVCGMEGALASVVGGLSRVPVIAVPTSVGYGAHFGGLAPLLSMLNTCAPGVACVNIDNGFGAGYMASLINQPRGKVT
jgi:pyridinium-3,5-biscarboxylic acid mononucleotide synthase